MKLSTNCGGLDNYNLEPADKIRRIAESGFRHIDFQFLSMADSVWMQDNWPDRATDVLQACSQTGLALVQSHSPIGNPLTTHEREPFLHQTRRSIECCGVLGIPQIVVHPQAYPGMTRSTFLDHNRQFYEALLPTAEKLDVLLLVENIGSPSDPHFTQTGGELRALVECIDHSLVQACWDTGHANVNQVDQYHSLRTLDHYLRGLHIHDNVGPFFTSEKGDSRQDLHTLPFLGTVSFDSIIHGLIDIGYTGFFTFEVTVPRRSGWQPFMYNGDHVRTLEMPSLDLCVQLYQTLYAIGQEILGQYNLLDS